MKLLVFAHVPPPHHGQSYMVKLMVEGLGRYGVEVVHVDARVSGDLEDVGSVRAGKLGALLKYCTEAILARFRTGAKAFYYVPAPGKRSAVYRDWVVMLLCRPFFPTIIFHWHALGVSEWLEREANGLERLISRWLLGAPELSIPLAQSGRGDADAFRSQKVIPVANGIVDPCPDFETRLLPRRLARLEARKVAQAGEGGREPFRLLFLAHCTRQKGVFEALEGVALYNAQNPVIPAHLKIAGAFMSERERGELEALIRSQGLERQVEYVGFVAGEAKAKLLEEADVLCFPTWYEAENLPVAVIEAMAFGVLPLVTRWRGIPEMLPEGYPAFVAPRNPAEVAQKIRELLTLNLARTLRQEFEQRFTLERHLEQMAGAIMSAPKR